MPSQLSASCLSSVRVRRLYVLIATVLLLASPMKLGAQGGCIFPFPCLSPPTAHYSATRVNVATGLNSPTGIGVDASGNVYVADSNNGRLLKETYANGGYTQTVVDTNLGLPSGVAIDAAGNLYVTDNLNGKVYKETLSGSSYTRTQLLTGLIEPYGIAVDTAGNLYIGTSNQYGAGLTKETLSGSTFTPTTISGGGISGTYGVALDASGNVYYSVFGSPEVIKLTLSGSLSSGTYSSAVADTSFAGPKAIAVDAAGNFYTADGASVSEDVLSGGAYYKRGIGSVPPNPPFYNNQAGGVAVDSQGFVYIEDVVNGVAYRVLPPDQSFVPTPVGTTTTAVSVVFTFDTGGTIGTPQVLAQGTPALDFADAGTGTCTTNGQAHSYNAGDTCTVDITFTPKAPGTRQGVVVLVDGSNNALATGFISGVGLGPVVNLQPARIVTYSFPFSGTGYGPFNVSKDAAGNIYVVDQNKCSIEKVTAATQVTTMIAGVGSCAGAFSGVGGLATAAVLQQPYGIAVNGRGDVFFSDGSVFQVFKIDAFTNTLTTVAGTGSSAAAVTGPASMSPLVEPAGLAIDGSGNLYVADKGGSVVLKIDIYGNLYPIAGTQTPGSTGDGGPATSAELTNPANLTFGADGSFYIADSGAANVRKVDGSTGLISTVAGAGPGAFSGMEGPATAAYLPGPQGIAIDAAGNLYISDTTAKLVYRVTAADGIIHILAGTYNNGTGGYTGDNGAANLATLSYPVGIAMDSIGNLFVADYYSGVVREVLATTSSAAFGTVNVGTSSPAIDAAVDNIGNAPLLLTALTLSPAVNLNGADTTCTSSTTVAPGASCVLGIEFLPTQSGTIKGYVTLNDNAGNVTPHFNTVMVSGTGAAQPPTQIAVSGLPAAIGSGGNLGTIIADIEDANGNVVTSSTAVVTVTITGPGGYSQVVSGTAVSGVATVNLASYGLTAPGTYTITTTSTGLATSIQTVTVAGPPTQIGVAPLPASLLAGGNAGTEIATLEDANGNPVTTSSASVTSTITGPNGFSQQVSGTAVNGVVTLNLSGIALTTPGTYTVTTTSTGLPIVTSTIIVTGPATQVAVSGLPTNISPGVSLGTETATLLNASNAVASASSGTVTTTITGPGGYSQTVAGATVNGVVTLNLGGLPAPTAPGTYTVTTTNSLGLPPVTSTFVVSAAPTQIAVTGLPSTVAFGGNLGTATATLLNASNSVATSGSAVVTATITGPGGFLQVVTGTTVNGVVSLNLSGIALTAPGTYTVTATSPNLASSVSTITVAAPTAAQPAQLAVAGLATAVGQSSNLGHITASVETSSGSVVTTSTAPVTLTITGPGGYSQTVTVAAVSGVAPFDLSGYSFPTLGTYTLTVASPGLPTATYTFTVAQDFTLTPSGSSVSGGGTAAAPSQTVVPGAPATYALTLAPAGVTFTQPITLSATGLPPGAAYSFNPPIVTPGPTAATSTLTITTANTVALQRHLGGLAGLTLAAMLLPFGSRRMRKAARRLSAAGVVMALLATGTLAALAGCGAGGLYGHSAQSYVITITATSGAFSHSTTVTLIEQ